MLGRYAQGRHRDISSRNERKLLPFIAPHLPAGETGGNSVSLLALSETEREVLAMFRALPEPDRRAAWMAVRDLFVRAVLERR